MGISRRAGESVLRLSEGDNKPVVAEQTPCCAVLDFDTFYRAEVAGLLALARALAGPAVAEDVAQETMLVVYRRWGEVRELASPGGWARGVCLHKAVSVVRRRSREQRLFRRLGVFRSTAGGATEDETFWCAVRALPLRQAQAVALYYALDLSVSDVATTLGCAEGTVKSHLSRARIALAQSWDLDTEEHS